MVRVASTDGCPLIRHGLRELVGKLPNVTFRWDTDNYTHVCERLSKEPVELLIVEPLAFGEQDGLRIVTQLRRQFRKTSLLIYTHSPSEHFPMAALRGGAAGFLHKDCAVKEVLSAVQTIASGKVYLSPTQAQQISLRYLSGSEIEQQTRLLSDREHEVLAGIRRGKRLKEIAGCLLISPKTVHTYKMRIMDRFHLTNNAALIEFAQTCESA
jgi:two-component system, NarL family, invasion response regulator UvrY